MKPTATEKGLLARHQDMHLAGEDLEKATRARDEAIYEATHGPEALTKAEVARLLGVRRETVYNAILRYQARGEENGR